MITPREYEEGREAYRAGKAQEACPYGHTTAGQYTNEAERAASECTRRGWWMAGWMDEDMVLQAGSQNR
jgi:ribosome modulation factor